MSQGMNFIGGLLIGCAVLSAAQSYGQTGSAIVTVEHKRGNTDPVRQENVLVFEDGKRAPITVWQPFTGQHSALQLLLLIDDSSASGLSGQLNELRSFVTALPVEAQIGVGYMANGRAMMLQDFTRDHALAAKAIRIPQSIRGGGSPFFTISSVTQQWTAEGKAGRREILMITDGVDRYASTAFNPDNPYVTKATLDAQRSGIPVFTIYFRGAGLLDADPTVTNGGQSYLVQLSQETGGKCLYSGTGNPVSLVPYLNDFSQILANQYQLEFKSRAKPRNGLVQLKLKMETPGIKLVAPTSVPVTP
jgi:hypothetical protein